MMARASMIEVQRSRQLIHARKIVFGRKNGSSTVYCCAATRQEICMMVPAFRCGWRF